MPGELGPDRPGGGMARGSSSPDRADRSRGDDHRAVEEGTPRGRRRATPRHRLLTRARGGGVHVRGERAAALRRGREDVLPRPRGRGQGVGRVRVRRHAAIEPRDDVRDADVPETPMRPGDRPPRADGSSKLRGRARGRGARRRARPAARPRERSRRERHGGLHHPERVRRFARRHAEQPRERRGPARHVVARRDRSARARRGVAGKDGRAPELVGRHLEVADEGRQHLRRRRADARGRTPRHDGGVGGAESRRDAPAVARARRRRRTRRESRRESRVEEDAEGRGEPSPRGVRRARAVPGGDRRRVEGRLPGGAKSRCRARVRRRDEARRRRRRRARAREQRAAV
mmetsp:Transcript_14517/g.52196  ORF Transcript_14517/g.52196 Transcript_14517/m.52196 type:complete len:346 (+) Transcript_14517:1262-2299(+)